MGLEEIAGLGCVDCHMPLVERPLVPGGTVRSTRQHTWRGGHDPEMEKKGLTITFNKAITEDTTKQRFTLAVANTDAAHYIPTGTPARHLTVQLRALNQQGKVLKEESYTLKRTTMWRPLIVDLWDTRLPPKETREYSLQFEKDIANPT